jgi:hypothetical protein
LSVTTHACRRVPKETRVVVRPMEALGGLRGVGGGYQPPKEER